MELVPDAQRLALMNGMLHDIDGVGAGPVRVGGTLSSEGEGLLAAGLILANPPFGTKKGGGLPSRGDFIFPTSNKQFAFLQHIYRGLKPGGRAGVVLPDNVLFEGNVGRQIRADLMDKCRLHTILRLPTGIFYAQGVETHVLVFERSWRRRRCRSWSMRWRSRRPPPEGQGAASRTAPKAGPSRNCMTKTKHLGRKLP